MKRLLLIVFILSIFCILSCEEPFETGLFVINKSSETHTFEVHPAMVETSTKELTPGKEWHYTSAWCGKHYIKVITAGNIETTVDVPSYDEKKAAVVEWDGITFKKYLR